MGVAMAMMLSLPAGTPLYARSPAKAAPPPKASANLLNHAAQGEVRVLVQVNEAAPKAMSASAVRTTNAVALDFAHRSPHSYNAIPFLAMTIDANDLARLQNDPRIAGIEEDRPNQLTLTDTTPLIGAAQSWAAGYTGAGHSIAILDTGFDTAHPMLQGKVVAEACFSSPQNGSISLCPNGQAQQVGAGAAINCDPLSGGSMGAACKHGTHVAGIALGSSDVLSGVAPGANLVGIQVFSKIAINCGNIAAPCVTAWDSDILKALDQAYAWRAQYHIATVNMSLGGGTYPNQLTCNAGGSAYKAMFALFNQAGIPVVIASGNSGNTNQISIPACVTGAISVGATKKDDTIAPYSNSANFLALLAPGNGVFSSVPSGDYITMSGTSMAAPHVAGAIAVLKSKFPNASVMQLIEALESTGVPIIDTRAGAGNRVKKRIAVFAALNVLDASWKSDAFEPNNTPAEAQPVALNIPQTHRFGVPDDRDWLTLQAQAGHTYRFETLNLGDATDTMIALYAGLPITNPIASNDDVLAGIDRRSVLTFTATVDGPLYVQVQDWDAAAFLNTRYDVQVGQIEVTPVTPNPPPANTSEPAPSQTPAPTPATTPAPSPSPTATTQPTKPKFKVFFPLLIRSR